MRETIIRANPNRLRGEISFEERQAQIEKAEFIEEQQRRKIKGSAYREFAQINLDGKVVRDVMLSLQIRLRQERFFWFIVQNMDGYNALIASYAVFQEALNMSRPTVARGIKFLKELGLLYVQKSGASNVYLLQPKLIWKSWGNNMKYCEFPAKVMLAQSEQYPDAREVFSNHMHKVMEPKN